MDSVLYESTGFGNLLGLILKSHIVHMVSTGADFYNLMLTYLIVLRLKWQWRSKWRWLYEYDLSTVLIVSMSWQNMVSSHCILGKYSQMPHSVVGKKVSASHRHTDLTSVCFMNVSFIRNQQHDHTKPDTHPREQTIVKETPQSLWGRQALRME